jgi:hypothetical protein
MSALSILIVPTTDHHYHPEVFDQCGNLGDCFPHSEHVNWILFHVTYFWSRTSRTARTGKGMKSGMVWPYISSDLPFYSSSDATKLGSNKWSSPTWHSMLDLISRLWVDQKTIIRSFRLWCWQLFTGDVWAGFSGSSKMGSLHRRVRPSLCMKQEMWQCWTSNVRLAWRRTIASQRNCDAKPDMRLFEKKIER